MVRLYLEGVAEDRWSAAESMTDGVKRDQLLHNIVPVKGWSEAEKATASLEQERMPEDSGDRVDVRADIQTPAEGQRPPSQPLDTPRETEAQGRMPPPRPLDTTQKTSTTGDNHGDLGSREDGANDGEFGARQVGESTHTWTGELREGFPDKPLIEDLPSLSQQDSLKLSQFQACTPEHPIVRGDV